MKNHTLPPLSWKAIFTVFFTFKMVFKCTVLFFISLFLAVSCSQKPITMDKMPTNQIVFGSGGGISGAVSEYALLEDGRLLEKDRNADTYKRVADIGRDKAQQYFNNVKTFDLYTLKFNEPGNIYHFITVKSKGREANKIVFGSNDVPAPESVKAFYQLLKNLLPKNNG
jgi:hypothetical protein